MINPSWPHPGNIAGFSYSKRSHFELFRNQPFQSYNVGDPDPATCDLKVYQDYLAYCFIKRNIPLGAKILEIGGGDSRVLKYFSRDYECWNADKCEGLGNGPVQFTSPHYRIVYDYVGSFNRELPNHYFDFVFSISALEHTPEEQPIREAVLKDIHRVLKPGCPSFHCFDAIDKPTNWTWVNGLIPYLYASAPLETSSAPLDEIKTNPDTYFMSQTAYENNWMPITKDPYKDFGRVFSINLLWHAPNAAPVR